MKENKHIYDNLSYEVINAFFETHNKLGAGLPEKPYYNGLAYILRKRGLVVESQKEFSIEIEEGVQVGEYWADLVVENKIIIEVKSVSKLSPAHEAQLINYLRISGIRVGLLVNFKNERVNFRRYTRF